MTPNSVRVLIIANPDANPIYSNRLTLLARGLVERGASVIVVSSDNAFSAIPGLVAIHKQSLTKPWFRPFSARSIRSELRLLKDPTIIHATDESMSGVALALAEELQIPYVVSLLDFPTSDRGLRVGRPYCRCVTTPCRSLASELAVQYGVPRSLLAFVPPGVVLGEPRPERRHALPRVPVVGAAGNHEPFSDGSMFISAVRSLRQSGLDLEAVIAGSDATLRRRAWKLGVASLLTFVDDAGPNAPFWSAIDLFCQTSTGPAVGWLTLHAQALGIPTVVTAVAGLDELVEDRVTGRLVASHDAEALAAAMRDLLEHPSMAQTIGRAGRESIRDRFDPDLEVVQTLNLYQTICAAATPHSMIPPLTPAPQANRRS